MAGTMLKIDIRRGKILDRLKQDGAVSVAQLASQLGATPVTIRSDLDALEKDGYLIRVQGGAVRKQRGQETPSTQQSRAVANHEEKMAIAKSVCRRIQEGDTIFINSGTTMEVLASILREHKNLNIVTNSIKVAMELGGVPSIRVILLGGEINTQYSFTYGSDAQMQLKHYLADWALLTLNGISAEGGVTTFHAEEATLNCMMMNQAKRTIIAADHTKVGNAGFFRFGEVKEGLELVTDEGADGAAVADLEAKGVKVQCAQK